MTRTRTSTGIPTLPAPHGALRRDREGRAIDTQVFEGRDDRDVRVIVGH